MITLLEKIQRGDFELPHHFETAKHYSKKAEEVYQYNLTNPLISDYSQRVMEAEYSSRSVRLKGRKHFEKGVEIEMKILKDLRERLTAEFDVDLWDKAHEKKRGKGTVEDLYWWYKKQCKQNYTLSELQIKLRK